MDSDDLNLSSWVGNSLRTNLCVHGSFAAGLIKALGDREADLIADGVITTPELYLYLRDYVELNSQEKQTPGFFPLKNHDRGEYIFKLPDLEPKLEPAPKLEKDNNPYRGLESFEERHSHFFFGRQEVIQDLFTQVTQPYQQLTVVLGISGAGKSSLVKAGLIPYLRQYPNQNWHIIAPMRLGTKPFGSLARVLSSLNSHSQTSSDDAVIGAELRDVVEKPATEMALYFEPANLVERLVDEVAQMPGALPLLSFSLSEMYINLHRAWIEEGQEDRALTVDEEFEQQGGVAGFLTRRANEEYHNQPDDAHRLTMSRVMLRMLEIQGGEAVKRRVLKRELIYPSEAENQRVERVLNCLVATRLIVTGKEAESDSIYYEPAHDFLVRGWDKLQDWLQKDRQQYNLDLQRLLTPAAFEWQEKAKSQRYLWNASPHLELLQQILHSEDNWFNQVENEFVKSSVARKKFNVRLRRGGAIAVIMLLSTGLILALLGQREAQIGQAKAAKQSARVNLNSSQSSLDAMLDSLRAGKALQNKLLSLIKPEDKEQLEQEVTGTLQSSVYQVRELNRMQGDLENTVPVRSIFNPEGNLLAGAAENGTVRLWNLQGQELKYWQADPQRVRGVSFSPHQDVLASAAESGRIILWNLQGEKLSDWQGHQGQVRDVSFSKNGQLIASVGGEDGIVGLWNLQGKQLQRWQAHKPPTKNVSFSPDYRLIATTGGDKTIRIWNLQGKLLQEFPLHSWRVIFSPDGKLLASAGQDGTVIAWDWKSRQAINQFQDHIGAVYTVAFSPDGKWLASGGQDSTVRRWNIEENSTKSPLHIYQAKVNSVTYSPDGKTIISSDDRGSVRLWDFDSGESLATWTAHQSSIDRISLNPEGNLLATVGEGGEIKLWRIDSFEQLISQVCSLMANYLQNNLTVDQSDHNLCHDIPDQ